MNAAVHDYFSSLQERIVAALEVVDRKGFIRDSWQRPEGGGGTSCIVEDGQVFERGGVNLSRVQGRQLPPSASAARPELAGRAYEAMGVSLVLHPRNPYCPTVHLNVRFFSAGDIWWFGGGMDLTPYYGFEDDARHFHSVCKEAVGTHYPRFKRWCDEYFHLKHRREPRGIGGIFFDDLADDSSFDLVKSVGDGFLEAYLPILERRRHLPYAERERSFQAYRRGRYVEFNLVYDRGTVFGLKTDARVESVLMSLPLTARWEIDHHPAEGSEEARLLEVLRKPREWA